MLIECQLLDAKAVKRSSNCNQILLKYFAVLVNCLPDVYVSCLDTIDYNYIASLRLLTWSNSTKQIMSWYIVMLNAI